MGLSTLMMSIFSGFHFTTKSASSLNGSTNDFYSDETVWIWVGQGASNREKIGANEAVEGIMDGAGETPIIVNEGEETDSFWYYCLLFTDKQPIKSLREAIGGEKEYAKISDIEGTDNAKLFVCSNATGKRSINILGLFKLPS